MMTHQATAPAGRRARRRDALYRRLEQARTLRRSGDRHGDPTGRCLAARPPLLAQAPTDGAADGATLDILVFQLAQRPTASPSSYVAEIYPVKELTPLPGLPPLCVAVS